MGTQIIVVFCLVDDILKALHHPQDPQCRMTEAEMMATALVARLYFKGNFCLASRFMYEYGYGPKMLSISRFDRQLHGIANVFLTLFLRLGETWKKLCERSIYIIDSYPIAVCDNYRIPRAKIYQGEEWRGYIASKKRYFSGVRIHMMVTEHGEPVEFFLVPGAFSDTSILRLYQFDVPPDTWLIGDKAYTDYAMEDLMTEADVHLVSLRKKNFLRPIPGYLTYLQASIRKMIETTCSLLERLLPKSIHAVTARGFELKVALFVLATNLNFLW